jgi:hypothetical protein
MDNLGRPAGRETVWMAAQADSWHKRIAQVPGCDPGYHTRNTARSLRFFNLVGLGAV